MEIPEFKNLEEFNVWFAAQQKPVDPEIEKVLHENLDNLYAD